MYPVALRDEIRTWVLIQGKSQRAAARHFGLSRNTVAKLLQEEPAANQRRYESEAPHKTLVRDASGLAGALAQEQAGNRAAWSGSTAGLRTGKRDG